MSEELLKQGDVRVVLTGEGDGADWDKAVGSLGQGSPFALFLWRRILQTAYRCAPCFLLAGHGQGAAFQPSGFLAGYINTNDAGQRILFSTRQGFGASDRETTDALLQAAEAIARWENCASLDVSGFGIALEDREGGYERTTFHHPLVSDPEAAWTALRGKTRNMIRRAEKDGVTVHGVDELRPAAALLHHHASLNLLPKGVAVPRLRDFEAQIEQFGGRARILCAMLDGHAIGSMLVLLGNGLAAYPVQNILPAFHKTAATQALTWRAMTLAAQEGCVAIDMGESRPGSPVYQSKLNFGAQPVALHGLRKDLGHGISTLARQRARAITLADRMFLRHAPMPIRALYGGCRVRLGRIA